MRAEVAGGVGDVQVEALFRPVGIGDATGEVSLGNFTRIASQSYELVFPELPSETLTAGEFSGIIFQARDAAGNAAIWPPLNVPATIPTLQGLAVSEKVGAAESF